MGETGLDNLKKISFSRNSDTPRHFVTLQDWGCEGQGTVQQLSNVFEVCFLRVSHCTRVLDKIFAPDLV